MYTHPANIYVPGTKETWFITNPVYKTADILTTDMIDVLTHKKAGTSSEETLEFLHKRGYMTETPLSLPDVYTSITPEPNAEISIGIALTYNCNLSCIYCFQQPLALPHATFDVEKIERAVDAISALKKRFLVFSSRDIVVELTGGEPLLPSTYAVVEKLLDALAEETRLFITTNGTHVAEFVDLLSSYPTKLKITIDGPPSVHDERRKTTKGRGTYHSIVQGVKKARDAGIPVAIKVNIDPHNSRSLHRLIEHFISYGWTEDEGIAVGLGRVGHTPEYMSVWTEAEYVEHMCAYVENHDLGKYFDSLFQRYNYFKDIISGEEPKTSIYRCRIDRSFFFSPDGRIYPCIVMNDYPIGTFYPQILFDERRIKKLKSRTIHNIPKCSQCPYALVCGGGCAAESMEQYNALHHPVCVDYPRILKAYIPYLLRQRERQSTYK